MVYTKAPVFEARFAIVIRLVSSACLVIATVLFVLLDKTSIQPVDRVITYALLLGSLGLNAAAFAMHLTSDRMLVLLNKKRKGDKMKLWLALLDMTARVLRLRALRRPMSRRWSESTSQLNLISYCLDKPKQDLDAPWQRWISSVVKPTLICIAKMLYVRPEILDDIIFIQSKRLSCSSRKSKDAAQYARDSNTKSNYDKKIEQCRYRGEGILKHDGKGILKHNNLRNEIQMQLKSREVRDVPVNKKDLLDVVLLGSIQNRDFDESLLMWHIATDLFPRSGRTDEIKGLMSIGETLSEYMLYLLVKQPEMLSATAGIGLLRYRDTCAEARRFFQSVAAWRPEQDDARMMLLLRTLPCGRWWPECGGRCSRTRSTSVLGARTSSSSAAVASLSPCMVWFLFLMAHMGIGDMYQIKQGDAKAKLIVHDQ
ncbi:hypothetical protein GUJ93_ZPchr0007g5588 [Zizania palustris]|uniref:DUF4220 domain-containing protein n=1 Tax=Zizania palustris TaxID=103762 RepID=A0A8J5TA88_ZIZPA|nr:hypothetical protein GUJ93_ZPchr0007g5588 [Zizania palustris]